MKMDYYSILKRGAFAYLAGILLIGIATLLIDWELVGASVFVSLFAIPSIMGWLASEVIWPDSRARRHFAFALPPLILVGAVELYLSSDDLAELEGGDLWRYIFCALAINLIGIYCALFRAPER